MDTTDDAGLSGFSRCLARGRDLPCACRAHRRSESNLCASARARATAARPQYPRLVRTLPARRLGKIRRRSTAGGTAGVMAWRRFLLSPRGRGMTALLRQSRLPQSDLPLREVGGPSVGGNDLAEIA